MKAKMVSVHSLYGACIFSVEAVLPEAILGKSFLRFASNLYVWSKEPGTAGAIFGCKCLALLARGITLDFSRKFAEY